MGSSVHLQGCDHRDENDDVPLANTGGGHLSSYYLQGMTPVHEAIVQIRGQGGAFVIDPHAVLVVPLSGQQARAQGAAVVDEHVVEGVLASVRRRLLFCYPRSTRPRKCAGRRSFWTKPVIPQPS